MPEKRITYKNKEIQVYWKPEICIHSANCVNGLSSVFSIKSKPWIDVNGASAEQIIKTIDTCPSKALSYSSTSEKNDMDAEKQIEFNIMKNGPLLVSGTFCIKDADGNIIKEGNKAAICRCGGSENKPFCDGQHKHIGFEG